MASEIQEYEFLFVNFSIQKICKLTYSAAA